MGGAAGPPPGEGTLAGAAEAGLRKRRRGKFELRGAAAGACGAPARLALDAEGDVPEAEGGEAALAWEDVVPGLPGGGAEVQVEFGEAGGTGGAAGKQGRISAEEQRQVRLVHRVYVLCLLGRGLWAEQWARGPLHQAFCLSLLPISLHPPADAPPGIGHLAPTLQWLSGPAGAAAATEAVGRWRNGLDGAFPGELRAVFLVGLCRVFGLPARLVCCLNPPPRHAAAVRREAEEAKRSERSERPKEPWFWVEVLAAGGDSGGNEGGDRWVHVDPSAAEVDQPGQVERSSRAFGRVLLYVAGFLGEGGARDVTRRYSSRFSGADARQRDQQWWRATLSPMEHAEAAALAELLQAARAAGWGGADEEPEIAAREEAELGAKWQAQVERDWPRTLAAAKDHPVFCLTRHLSQHQTVRPGSSPTGKFIKGEPLYRRGDVCQLCTRAAWVRRGRTVRPGERPASFVEAGKKTHRVRQGLADPETAYGGDDEPPSMGGSAGSPVFGVWQTDPWRPAVVEGGRIPRNKYGNIECPPFVPTLPEGTVHLRLPRISRVCRDLGIDHAAAMVGFERKQGRFFPAIEGVVVLREREPEVVGAYLKAEQAREYKALQARMRAAEAAWADFLRFALAEHRVHLEFGGGGGAKSGGAAALGDAALLGAGVQQVLHRDGFLVETEEI